MSLLAEVFLHFTTRRLDTQALPLTAFLLLKEDEEEKKDKAITTAFVEAFKDTRKSLKSVLMRSRRLKHSLMSLLGNQFRPGKLLMKMIMKKKLFLRQKKT